MDDDILQEFLAESWENLSNLDNEIVTLEKDPSNSDLLNSIFRTIHTIKGTCGFLGLTGLGSVAHSAENVLGKMRDNVLPVTPGSISLILEAIDVIKSLLEGLEATGDEPQGDFSVLTAQLDALAEGKAPSPEAPQDVEEGDSVSASDPPATSSESPTTTDNPPTVADNAPVASSTPSATTDNPPATSSVPNESPPEVSSKVQTPKAQTPKTVPEKKTKSPSTDDSNSSGSPKTSVADLSIRVNVEVLDSLMNLVGELVLARNQLLQLARNDDESKYAAPITHLNRVTTDLQEGVMKTRMQPIGNAWSKLPRLVRDLSQTTGRHIELEMSGEETELDRTVLDAIKDPLTHMVRNSADHGIELPEERIAAGKSETGTIKLNAFHEGGHVIISIEDDGAGIDADKVLNKAIEKGIVSEQEAAKMKQGEILSLIFRAGLSTSEQVSSVSGRGVGMDVVRTSIERIGGTVDLSSVRGSGTSVRIKIPLTLAIVSALVVKSGGQSFAIPQLGVVELVRLAAEDRNKIEKIHKNEVFRLRDRLLPLVHLDEVLELNARKDKEDSHRDINIVVVQVGDEQFGLIVDEVFDTEEIVVKPVGILLKDVAIYQGTTILGDGRVIMILDVTGIADLFGGLKDGIAESEKRTESDSELEGDMTSLLLFNAGGDRTMSVPLSLVARLEEFPKERIEGTGGKLVVQYRGDLLPLQPIHGMNRTENALDPQPVIVFSEGNRSMGIMVDEIQDILKERLIIRMNSQESGVMGTAIINGKATDIIDTQHYVTSANPDWFNRQDTQGTKTILVIDDSLFFRQLAMTSLESEQFKVIAIDSAVTAVELIEHGKTYDVIISDIEMPMMDGFEFAEWFRSRPEASNTPLIALSSIDGRTSEQRALDAGFDHFHTKFNPQQLVRSIEELLYSKSKLKTGVTQ